MSDRQYKALAYYKICRLTIHYESVMFYSTDANKLFMTVINEFLLQAKVFVPGRPFKPSQMFVGKVESLP